VDGVAAEVAEEVFVFFEDGDADTGAREEEAEHDAGGASADDAGCGGWGLGGGGHRGLRILQVVGCRDSQKRCGTRCLVACVAILMTTFGVGKRQDIILHLECVFRSYARQLQVNH